MENIKDKITSLSSDFIPIEQYYDLLKNVSVGLIHPYNNFEFLFENTFNRITHTKFHFLAKSALQNICYASMLYKLGAMHVPIESKNIKRKLFFIETIKNWINNIWKV